MRAILMCNGEINNYLYIKKFLVNYNILICVDGGIKHAKQLSVRPDVLLGDFDSLDLRDLQLFTEQGVRIISYPTKKDKTDTELAVALAIEEGHHEIIILGGLGSRFDHSLANVFLLKKMLEMNVYGTIINEYNEIRLIKDRITLNKQPDTFISLLPVTNNVYGVNSYGLYYPLKNKTLKIGDTIGISNEFMDDTAVISIRKGILMVIVAKE